MSSQVASHLNVFKVQSERLAGNISTFLEATSRVAQLLEKGHRTDLVENAVASHKETIALDKDVTAYLKAINDLHHSYRDPPEGQQTNFEQILGARTQALLDTSSPEADPRHVELKEDIWEVHHEPRENEGGESGAQVDEDIVFERGELAPNVTCPISGKQMLDLDNPVEDSKGFVYERAAIVQYINRNGGRVKCPVAATLHVISAGELKRASRVVRAQKRQRERGGAGLSNADEDDDVVLDC